MWYYMQKLCSRSNPKQLASNFISDSWACYQEDSKLLFVQYIFQDSSRVTLRNTRRLKKPVDSSWSVEGRSKRWESPCFYIFIGNSISRVYYMDHNLSARTWTSVYVASEKKSCLITSNTLSSKHNLMDYQKEWRISAAGTEMPVSDNPFSSLIWEMCSQRPPERVEALKAKTMGSPFSTLSGNPYGSANLKGASYSIQNKVMLLPAKILFRPTLHIYSRDSYTHTIPFQLFHWHAPVSLLHPPGYSICLSPPPVLGGLPWQWPQMVGSLHYLRIFYASGA